MPYRWTTARLDLLNQRVKTIETLLGIESGDENMVNIQFGDSPSIDAFARARVSEPETLFDSKQIHDKQPLLWDDVEVSGGSTTSTWTQVEASTMLGVALNTAGRRVRQTFRRFNYQPGKSQMILMTGTLGESGGGTGITRSFGLYDNSNGFFLIDDEGTYKIVKRSNITGSVVNTEVAQSSWNLDTMDGTGDSGITLDFTKSQILLIDMEWLGVGRVRIGFVVDGIPVYAHQFTHANTDAGVYISTPNLPLRYEIENDGTGAASELEHICCSVISEGGTQDVGIGRSASNGATAVVAASAGTKYALCGIKLNSSNLDGIIKLVGMSVLETNAVDYEWSLVFNPTIASTAPTFNNVTSSIVDFAVGVAANTVTGGEVIVSGYVKGGKETGVITQAMDTAQQLGSSYSGTQDELWLVAMPLSANADFVGSLSWKEIS